MVPVSGEIWMDEGAVHAVRRRGKSLFSAGIVRVTGDFNAQDCVLLCDAEGNPFAQGLTNYSSSDISNIKVRHGTFSLSELLVTASHLLLGLFLIHLHRRHSV